MIKRPLYQIGLEVIQVFDSYELTPIEGMQVISDLFSTVFALMNPDPQIEEKKAMLEILFSNIRNDIISKGVYYRGHD